jgi:hypothetical protein
VNDVPHSESDEMRFGSAKQVKQVTKAGLRQVRGRRRALRANFMSLQKRNTRFAGDATTPVKN